MSPTRAPDPARAAMRPSAIVLHRTPASVTLPEPTAPPLVVSVILNTNRRDDTLACLTSLTTDGYPAQHVIVLDNASTDGSLAAIRSQFPAVEVIALRENLGYAGNNNVGIKAALARGARWVFVLNEDTVLDAGAVATLVAEGERDPHIGIVGPMVLHHAEPTVIQSAGGLLGPRWESRHAGHNEDDRGQFADARDVEWVSGCALMVRREVIETVGAIDARFFYYWEETEWCVRARRAGWRVVHVPAARLWHKGVQRDYRPGPGVTYYDTRNRFLLLATHRAPLAVRCRAWLRVGRTLVSWSVRPRWRHLRDHRDAMWAGARDAWAGRWGQRG